MNDTSKLSAPVPIPPALRLTAWWHAAMGAGLLASPAHAAFWLGGAAASHGLLVWSSMWPRSALIGPNLVRLPAGKTPRVALSFDDGPDPEVTPRVLDQLAEHGVRASFFCIGAKVRRESVLARRIVAEGHDIENHTHAHSHAFAFRGPRGLLAEIASAQHVIADCTGRAPRFFRAPAGMRNPWLAPVLQRLDLRLASWTRRGFDTTSREPRRVLARLVRGLADRDILLLHDGHAARTAEGEPVVLSVLPALLERLRTAGLAATSLRAAIDGPVPLAGTGDPPAPR